MRKRPLCVAALILLVSLWILPKDIWLQKPDISSGEKVVLTGIVTKREEKEAGQAYYLKNCQCDRSNSNFSVLAFTQKGSSYPIGCELSLYGTIYQVAPADNPGQFDGESYYQSQDILYTFQVEMVLKAKGEHLLKEKIASLKDLFSTSLDNIYEERDAGILKAVLLGDKSTLREEDQLLYQKNGISHLLAISGLHISMIGISMYRILRKCKLTFWEAGIPSGILLLIYGTMTGFGISTIRAVCMFLVLIFADICGRTYDMASAMALAAIMILLKNPLQARQAGFLLSFGAVLGICFVYPILQSVFETQNKFLKICLFSISLSLVTYPITVHFFYEYPLYSIILNFIVIPWMPLVMGMGGAGMIMGSIWVTGGKIIGFPVHFLLSFYEILGKWFVTLPGAVIKLGREEPWQLILYYVILLVGLLGLWYGRRKIFGCFLPLALLVVTLRFHEGLEFTALSVGQGDCLYMRMEDGTTCLVDGGSVSEKYIGEYRIVPYLKYSGVSELDYVFLTHLDEDHISGVRELIEMQDSLDGIRIDTIFYPEIANPDDKYMEMWELSKEKGIHVEKIGAGDRLKGDDYDIACLYPIKGSSSTDKNDSSIVLQVNFRNFSMLLSGDMGFDGEKELLKRGVLTNIDVWKVSHHGSKYSGGETFLHVIDPELSLISVGRNNYGHPSKEMLERLWKAGSRVETTLESGALQIESDGDTFSLSLQRGED